MAMRLSGMMSGMDTETIVQDLVKARQAKIDKVKKAQTKQSWQQDAWKELNTKLKNLQAKFVSSMRFSTAYSKKVSQVSDSSVASVIAGEDAVDSVQTLQVNRLAKTAYLTGGVIASAGEAGAAAKLTDLKDKDGNAILQTTDGKVQGSFSLGLGGSTVEIAVTENTTISDVLTQLKDAGLNANFDAKNKRFFISAKESGADKDFSITANDAAGEQALRALGLQADLGSDKATAALYKTYAEAYVAGNEAQTIANLKTQIDEAIEAKRKAYLEEYKGLASAKEAAEKAITDLQSKYTGDGKTPLPQRQSGQSLEDYVKALDAEIKKLVGEDGKGGTLAAANNEVKTKEDAIKAKEEEIANAAKDSSTTPDKMKGLEQELTTLKEQLVKLKSNADAISARKADIESLKANTESVQKYDDRMNDITTYVTITATDKTTADGKTEKEYSAAVQQKLTDEVNAAYVSKAAQAADMLKDYKKKADGTYETDADGSLVLQDGKTAPATGATKVSGQDAEIVLNGAVFTGSSNTFAINGLTITAYNATNGKDVTITTRQDTDGIYDMVKKFLKEYNAVINELDKLYNAASAKGFEPLTNEEKDVMSESEVKEYETKIKDALLRRDSNVSSISSGMRDAMNAAITVNGKEMRLFDFGIDTLGYFNAADNEKNALHIDGDPDDGDTSGKADKLKGMISSDPDTVVAFFTQLSRNLYEKMHDLSTGVKDYRSYGSFFDDKKMKTDYDNYTKKIAEMEQKLNDYEDKWYKKFSKMETAMAKMQSNVNALSGLLGG